MTITNNTVSAHPTKQFFVSMLTRDIDLHDAILDLLDNCVDGAIRATRDGSDDPKRYRGFRAKINIQDEKFTISDNCGGIEPRLAEHAFMMGRPDLERDDDIPTVGMYGIGMKRAIFKMGRSSRVISQSAESAFMVTILPDWLDSATDWDLPYETIEAPFTYNGTLIEIEELNSGVSREFFDDSAYSFMDRLEKMISTHYCFIIHKGFDIYLNDKKIIPVPLTLMSAPIEQNGLAPYLYEGVFKDVKVVLAVGFVGQAPSEDEIDYELEQRRSSEDAGWTIICNDRVIVYKDKTRLTGWGVGRVPSYHTQFITISGVVEFQSNHAENLPVTTTKRGIDSSSDMYLHVKDFMMEGMKYFTNHTNTWKKNKEEEKKLFESTGVIDVRTLPRMVPPESWTRVRNQDNEKKFAPTLPRPSVVDPIRQVRFSKPLKDIKIVAEYLFEDPDYAPSEVGALCFDTILSKAKEEI